MGCSMCGWKEGVLLLTGMSVTDRCVCLVVS